MFISPSFASLSTVGLSWYIHNAAIILSTRISKKPYSNGTDRGESLIFRQFIHSWVCYELVKVLHVFGLQPKIRSDIADWSPNLHNTFGYFTVKKLPEYKEDAMRVLNILFNKTEHNSYLVKNVFGSKQKITQAGNPTLYLVVLTWLRQLQQCFYEYNDVNMAKDWNRHGRYCSTTTRVAQNAPTLSNINMSLVRSEKKNIVLDMIYFKPNED